MKVGLICPIPHLKEFATGEFHLLLMHLLEDPFYASHYKKMREKGAYLCLDNSAHEFKEGQDAEKLMLYALHLQAQEVVIPDVLFEAEATIQRCIDTHEVWFEHDYQGMKELNPILMYVPQSANISDYKECLRELLGIHLYAAKKHDIRKDLVLGISKDYEIWDGGIMRLLKEVIIHARGDLLEQGINCHVHLLGWGRDLGALARISKKYPWIRSTDSAKPFVYARGGILLRPSSLDNPPEYPGRPHDYFTKKLTKVELVTANANVRVFKEAARDE